MCVCVCMSACTLKGQVSANAYGPSDAIMSNGHRAVHKAGRTVRAAPPLGGRHKT